jgi:protein TonB
VSENRFLQSFSALLASAILVCGTHLLLIASSNYDPPLPEPAQPAATPAPLPAARAPSTVTVMVREATDPEITASTSDRSRAQTTPFVGDQSAVPPPSDTVAADTNAPEPTAPLDSAAADTTAPEPNAPLDSAAADTTAPEPNAPLDSAAADTNAPEPNAPLDSAAADTAAPEPNAPLDSAAADTTAPEPNAPLDSATADKTKVEPAPSTQEGNVASAPELVAPAIEPSESPAPSQHAQHAEHAIESSQSPAPAEHAEHAEPAATASIDTTSHAPAASPTGQQAASNEPVAPSTPKAARAKPVPTESVPLPTPKPVLAADTKKVKPAPKPAPQAAQREEVATTESKPHWAPMALAPADKDTVAKPNISPKRAEGAGAYNAKIWAALAGHKPKAGKSGSATVTFAIGPAGGLRSARVSGSSGDAQLDQMALATVRNAAPFPPPPDPASASYTIRIYFR